jgi:hypothetical protein
MEFIMHKKDQVKTVIEKYINKGRDFFELTPSYLENLDELKDFSERTLKRGRTEFKLEHPDMIQKHSRNSASTRKKIFKYLDNSPKTTPKALDSAFPDVGKKTLLSIRALWKKEKQLSDDSSGESHSLRQSVFDYLEQHPKTTLRKLEKTFPGFNPKTVSNYLDQWRKEHAPTRKVSLKQRITEYLDANPGIDLQQLRKAFADTKPASVNTYFSLWKNNHIQTSPQAGPSTTEHLVINTSDSDIVQALKTTIDAQQKTIEVLKSQNEILRERQSVNFPELEGMTRDEIKTVERVIQTFIRGIRSM